MSASLLDSELLKGTTWNLLVNDDILFYYLWRWRRKWGLEDSIHGREMEGAKRQSVESTSWGAGQLGFGLWLHDLKFWDFG